MGVWFPGNQRFPFYPTSDRVPNAVLRDIKSRRPQRDLFYQNPSDIFTIQLMMRSSLPAIPQAPKGVDQGLKDLGV